VPSGRQVIVTALIALVVVVAVGKFAPQIAAK
jgi:hypothetical protein